MRFIITSFILLFSLSALLAQSKVHVKLCNNEVSTNDLKTVSCELTKEEILKCKELKVSDKDYIIQSYEFSFQTPYKTLVPEIKAKGSKFTEKMISQIKRYNPNKIWIEKVVLINPDGKTIRARSLIIDIIK